MSLYEKKIKEVFKEVGEAVIYLSDRPDILGENPKSPTKEDEDKALSRIRRAIFLLQRLDQQIDKS